MKGYILYSGNAWLETSSLVLLAVCLSTEKAVKLAIEHSKGGRDENYIIMPVEMDELEG